MPIPKAQVVHLSDAERHGLEKLIKRHQVGQQIALRARIVLAAAHEQKNKEIAQANHSTLDTVRLRRNRLFFATFKVGAFSLAKNSA